MSSVVVRAIPNGLEYVNEKGEVLAVYTRGCLFFKRVPTKPTRVPPMDCTRCNVRNEYLGPEHLENGVYTCRSCKR